jgi:hypothetical protein
MGEVALKHIRLATESEIDGIRDRADLMPGHTQVLALDADSGTPDLAVVRNCIELNPVIYGSATNDMRRARFLYSLEERFLGANVDRYYFMLAADAEHYQKVAESWGAEKVSPHPEIRYLKVIK